MDLPLHALLLLLLLLLQTRWSYTDTCVCTTFTRTPVHLEADTNSHVVTYVGSGLCYHGSVKNGWLTASGHKDVNIQEDQLVFYDDCRLLDAIELFEEAPLPVGSDSSHNPDVYLSCLVDGQTLACFAPSFEVHVKNFTLQGGPDEKVPEKRFLMDNQNTCDFEANSLCSWQNVQKDDDFDWIRFRSSTPTDDTGPDFDHTLRNDRGNYMFIETSSPRAQNEKAWLLSPQIQSPGPRIQCFQFWYHMKGSSVGQLNVYQSQDGSLPGNLVWSLAEQQGPDWLSGQVPLNATVGYELVVEATVGFGYQGDIAVDDFNFTEGFCPPLPTKASRTNLTNTVVTSTSQPYAAVPTDLILQYFCENINNVNCSRYEYDVPCGTDGRFYPNVCVLTKEKCSNSHLAIHTDYKHCSVFPGWTTVSSVGTTPVTSILGTEPPVFQLFCENKDHIVCNHLDVVCGSDGHFYPNRCEQLKATCTNPALTVSSNVGHCTVTSVNGHLGGWSDWSTCHCNSTQTRSRKCDNPPPAGSGLPCTGMATESRTCKPDPNTQCPVNGQWSSWYPWVWCSATCGVGERYRLKTCTHPRPQYGGLYCEGEAEEREACQLTPCIVDGAWGSWYQWSQCSMTCGVDEIVRARTCTNPRPQNGGKYCPGESEQRSSCSALPCAGQTSTMVPTTTDIVHQLVCQNTANINCGTNLDVVCGTDGIFYQNQCELSKAKCTNPGLAVDPYTSRCHNRVDSGWSEWSLWSVCDVSCATGHHTRYRLCDNPPPENFGKFCVGDDNEVATCFTKPCPMDGGWSQWSAWSDCPVDAGANTTKSRTRACSQPAPQYGGANCTGGREETTCCPVNGGWTSWVAWSVCTGDCTSSHRERIRQCNNPRPSCGSRYCVGSGREQDHTCIPDHCTTTTTTETMTPAGASRTTAATATTGASVATSTRQTTPTSIASTTVMTATIAPDTVTTISQTTQAISSTGTAAAAITTPTKPPQPMQCTVCMVNPALCFALTEVRMCPDSYCISEVTNSADGSKVVDRRCGTLSECENDYWHTTSDDPDCQDYDPGQNTEMDIHCTYCCTTDNCNKDVKPAQDTLYNHTKA